MIPDLVEYGDLDESIDLHRGNEIAEYGTGRVCGADEETGGGDTLIVNDPIDRNCVDDLGGINVTANVNNDAVGVLTDYPRKVTVDAPDTGFQEITCVALLDGDDDGVPSGLPNDCD